MARIKYTALIESIRGSIGGTTFQSNKYGFTIKSKPNMTIPKSPLQSVSKRLFAQASMRWRTIGDVARQRFVQFASDYPQYSKNNPNAQLDGYSIWMLWTPLNLLTGRGFEPSIVAVLAPAVTLSYVFTVSGGVFNVSVTSSDNNDAWMINFFISAIWRPTRNFIGTKPKFIHSTLSSTHVRNLTDDYTEVYGSIPEVGDLIAVSVDVRAFDSPFVVARDEAIYTVVAP